MSGGEGNRPCATPTLMAALTAAVPARIAKKLDASPTAARAWTWNGLTIRTDGGETVTLAPSDGVVSTVDQMSCTCLLSPRCFHILAVASSLELAEADSPALAASSATGSATSSERAPVAAIAPTTSQRAAAALALRVAEDLLRAGASGAGAVLQGELLRAVHAARVEGAHRIASAALRVVRGVRALRDAQPSFSTGALVDDIEDLLTSAHLLVHRDTVPPSVLGVARRAYHPRGNLRLEGLCCEPVIARGGFAGVTSWLTDERGTVFTLSDIQPASPSRARGAYDLGVAIGDTTLTHRALCREGLIVQNAMASHDLRLGSGKDVKAVRAPGASSWRNTGARVRFDEPFADQVARAFASFALDAAARPHASGCLFFSAMIVGHDGVALVVNVDGAGSLRLIAAADHEELPYHENLRQLARAAGRSIDVIARLIPDARRTVAPIAIAAPPDVLPLASALGSRVNLGLDVLQAVDIGDGRPVEIDSTLDSQPCDPLHPLRRRIERIAIHGIQSLPAEAGRSLDGDRAALERVMLVRASDVLAEVYRASLASARGESGIGAAWLAATTYERVATQALRHATFV